MEPRYEFILIGFFMVGTFVTIMTIGAAWLKRPSKVSNKELAEIAERLSRLEQSVDAIAVETERISEGQRFTTKLLSDKSPARSVAP